jgi:DNA-directed RNA polymerase specialized sigma24 family protein
VSDSPPHAAYLASPEVRDAIGKALRRRGVGTVDTEDLTQDVIERALRTSQPPPNLQECVALVRKIATDLAIDHSKLARGRAKYNAGPYENPDDVPALAPTPGQERDPIDAGRQLEVLNREIAAGNLTARQLSIVERNAEQASHAEIASQLQLAPQTVRNELGAARRVARQSWATYLAAALFTSIALLVWFRSEPEKVSAGNPYADPLQRFEEQRDLALVACDRQLWKACLDGLDQAAKGDPVGDSDPRVQQARAEAQKHLAESPKPNEPAPGSSQPSPK